MDIEQGCQRVIVARQVAEYLHHKRIGRELGEMPGAGMIGVCGNVRIATALAVVLFILGSVIFWAALYVNPIYGYWVVFISVPAYLLGAGLGLRGARSGVWPSRLAVIVNLLGLLAVLLAPEYVS